MRPVFSAASGVMLALAFVGEAGAGEGPAAQWAWVSGKILRERDADRALRETLTTAADAASERLSHRGAFNDDPAHRIPLPDPLRSLRGDWNAVGRSGALERLQTRMNRAAEMSAPAARPLLADAIAGLDFSDAVAIVRSGDEAATQFLAVRTRTRLLETLRPAIVGALDESGAFAALGEAAAAAGAPQRAEDYRKAVIDGVVAGEVNALFAEMARQERGIRADPGARGLPELRDVFSSFDAVREAGG